MSDEIPYNIIWLQHFENDGDVTWCSDRVNQSDIRYVRVGFLTELMMTRQSITRYELLEIVNRVSAEQP